MNEAYKTGAAFWNIFDWMASGTYNTPEHLAAGKAMMPLAAKDQKNVAYGLNMNGGNRVWTIGAKTNYPELSMAIINWLSTPEGVMVSNWGPQGLTWDYKDGKPYLTELGEATQKNGDTVLTGDYADAGKWVDGTNKINNTTWSLDAVNPDAKNGDTYNYRFWETRKDQPVSAIEQAWRTKVGASNANEYLEKNGNITISVGTTYSESAKSNELTTTWNQVKDAIKTYSWKAIYAKTDAEFDKIVNEMTDKANSYGYAECVKFQEGEAAIRKGLEDKIKNK
jgi:multiple sugar transport system substrate-binding protein/putative aldouronate transport system substrate-binding protein